MQENPYSRWYWPWRLVFHTRSKSEGRLPEAATMFSSSVRMLLSSSRARVWLKPSGNSMAAMRLRSSSHSFLASATWPPHWLL